MAESVVSREWCVEQYRGGVARCIGKAVPNHAQKYLSSDDLESIWDLANWGASQPTEFVPKDDTYRSCQCFMHWGDARWGYVDMGKTSCCNDDIFIRPHYELERGYYLKSDRSAGRDEWVYGTREEWLREMASRAF